MSYPAIDPSEHPGTPEWQEVQEERKRRALQRQWHAYEDDLDRSRCRHA